MKFWTLKGLEHYLVLRPLGWAIGKFDHLWNWIDTQKHGVHFQKNGFGTLTEVVCEDWIAKVPHVRPVIDRVNTFYIVKERHHQCDMILVECCFDNPFTDDLNTGYGETVKNFYRTNCNRESHKAHFQAVIPSGKFSETEIESL